MFVFFFCLSFENTAKHTQVDENTTLSMCIIQPVDGVSTRIKLDDQQLILHID